MVAASPRELKNAATVSFAIAALLLFLALPVPWRLSRSFPALPVTACQTYTLHGTHAQVVLANGVRTLDLTWEDISHPERCLALHQAVAKRRGEFGYRIDGQLAPWQNAATYCGFLGCSALFAILGALFAAAKRRRLSAARGD